MKPSRVGAVAWILLMLGGPARTTAQVPVEEEGWWEMAEAEGMYAAVSGFDYADVGYDEWSPAMGPRGPERGWVERGPVVGGRGFPGAAPGYGHAPSGPAWGPDPRCGFRPRGGWAGRCQGPRWVVTEWGRIGLGGGFGYGTARVLGPRELEVLLGFRTMARLHRHAVWLGARGPLAGRVVDLGRRGVVLQVRAGGVPLAELGDRDRDRRMDWVRLNDGWRGPPSPVRGGRAYPAAAGTAYAQGYQDGLDAAYGSGYSTAPETAYGYGSQGPGYAPDHGSSYAPAYAPGYGPGAPAARGLPESAPPPYGHLQGPTLTLRNAQATDGGVRYAFSVPNWDAFAPELFRPAPDLPACGLNRMSSRTWVDVMDGGGRRLYGFCALTTPRGLDGVWTFVPEGDPASEVYLVLTDRLTGESVTSNMVALR